VKIFVDSADTDEIKRYLDWGVCDGVTTNPSINLAAGVTSIEGMEQRALEIASLIAPRPLSVEVVTDDLTEMVKQGRLYAGWADNINIKIPITNTVGEACLPVVRTLCDDGIDVNVTAMMTFNQAMLAAKAGARFVSLFGGRIDDEGGDATVTIRRTREWLDRWGDDCPNSPEIIVGSTRTRGNISDWAATGAHVLTVTPAILGQMVTNARTKETVTQFLADAEQALSSME